MNAITALYDATNGPNWYRLERFQSFLMVFIFLTLFKEHGIGLKVILVQIIGGGLNVMVMETSTKCKKKYFFSSYASN